MYPFVYWHFYKVLFESKYPYFGSIAITSKGVQSPEFVIPKLEIFSVTNDDRSNGWKTAYI